MKKSTKIFSLIMIIMLALPLTNVDSMVSAASVSENKCERVFTISQNNSVEKVSPLYAENEDYLLDEYINKLLLDELPDGTDVEQYYSESNDNESMDLNYSNYAVSAYSTLNDLEKSVYTFLKNEITEVANGTATANADGYIPSTFTYTLPVNRYSYTMSDLGIATAKNYYNESDINEVMVAASQKFNEVYSNAKVHYALLSDCPYELYWYNKVLGLKTSTAFSFSLNASNNVLSVALTTVEFKFTVHQKFARTNGSSYYPYQLNPSTCISGAQTAIANAREIVTKYENCSDYDKLYGYLTEICSLVEYDHDAVNRDIHNTDMGPWQIIYCFDKNPATNIVCEGYSKAFQYLFDLSTFSNSSIESYIVTGTLTGGTGAGGHMWNVVSIDGKNYIVDITNCDGNTIGAPDKLFLAGLPGSANTYYTFKYGPYGSCIFEYDDKTKDLYGLSILTLHNENYDPSTSQAETKTITVEIPADYNTDSTIWVDGIQYPATLTGTSLKATLPNSTGKTATVYKYNSNGVFTGMKVYQMNWRGDFCTAIEMPEFEDLLSYHGFSIRITGKSGIRYKAGLDKDFKERLKTTGVNGYKLKETGILYMAEVNRNTATKTDGYDFIFETIPTKKVTNGQCYYNNNGTMVDAVCEIKDGRARFASVLVGIPENRYATDFSFRSYAILEKNGVETVIYGDPVAKSIYSVAKLILNTNQYPVGSATYNYVKNIVDVVEGN